MPVYQCKVRGEKAARIVKAESAAKARDHIVEASAMSSDDLADAIAGGSTIETAGASAPAPAEEPANNETATKETPAKG
jgi:hypothetical protein